MTVKITDKVRVDLGPRSYDIVIGPDLLGDLGYHLEPVLSGPKLHVVTDETVYALYGDALTTIERDMMVTVLPPGEAQKSFESLQTVLDNCFKQGLERGDSLLALGGGVIGDLTGFAASIYKRGCGFVQVPTTLLAQVDSSVGGKTGINVPQGKNLVGAFYQPSLVLADMSALSTLPERDLKAGYAEVLKYGLLGDAEFFNWLDSGGGKSVLSLEGAALMRAIAQSCQDKASIVAEDEREKGRRALLNLGHTFAHALEAAAGYGGQLLHGEAVSAGMEMAFEFSARQGLCPQGDVDKVSAHIAETGLTPIKDTADYLARPEALLATMRQDKKNQGGAITLILARGIGEAFVQTNASEADILAYLQALKARYV